MGGKKAVSNPKADKKAVSNPKADKKDKDESESDGDEASPFRCGQCGKRLKSMDDHRGRHSLGKVPKKIHKPNCK